MGESLRRGVETDEMNSGDPQDSKRDEQSNSIEVRGQLKTAVLLLVFNRPELTKRIFSEIRRAEPQRLYIAADGPRPDCQGETEKVEEVRKIVSAIDWRCKVHTLFREHNMGCKYAVSSAIDWFFEHEESGIILEDDCLPSQSFFWFCEACLEMYKDDLRVWHIAGTNTHEKQYSPVPSSFVFSNYGSIWGWATWRDRWAHYDVELTVPDQLGLFEYVLNAFDSREFPDRRLQQFQKIMDGLQTWDYQWFYTRAANSGLSIVPTVNLVANIGFGADATHTTSESTAVLERKEISFPLKAPPCVVRDKKRDLEQMKFQYRLPLHARAKRFLLSLMGSN